MRQCITRRELLKSAAAAGAVSLLRPLDALAAPAAKREAFRFVHFTDIHIQRKRGADFGFIKALKAAEALRPKPDFILTGGDLVMDVLDATPQEAKEAFELFCKTLADNTSLPVHHTIGNHDVFGWSKKSKVSPDAVGYGKAMVKEHLKLAETYQRFDHKGWRFFCLDNIQPGGDERYPYEGFIDEPQIEWLKGELEKTDAGMPIVMCEHIPMLTVTGFGHNDLQNKAEWKFPSAYICTDAARRMPIYRRRNVRLCLSGHIHERDRIEFQGITFINDGAVSGSWWKGPHHGVEEGFGIVDCKPDGVFEHQYFDYGWEAVKG